ncbi:MAG: CDP-alcohol phosphatidyltransferase family protein [Candidatus Saccharibacteria bacterium]|nr:CDP-alcohol phosphatidyltransferase family protein [Candidatus Saccharibacteria bacterium]
MSGALETVRNAVRNIVKQIAGVLHRLSGGSITPNMVTVTSLLAHVPIAYFIATGSYVLAAGLLVVFGLMDALDGELARLQKKASAGGMLLDASTDRMKEVILYIGAAYALINRPVGDYSPALIAALVVAACGGSLLVSYVKAKGETAVKDGSLTANQVNRLFQNGLMRYEVRMFALVVGLLVNELALAVGLIAVTAWYTAFARLFAIYRKLG